MTTASKVMGFGTGILLVGTLLGCGDTSGQPGAELAGTWEEIVAAAADEGRISFYSGLADVQNERLSSAFTAQYPDITVQTQRGAGELAPRVEAEMSAGADGADVFAVGDTTWYKLNAEQLLPAAGPSTEDWEDDGWAVEDSAPIASAVPNSVFVWNTDLFPEGFQEWDDLLEPAVRGKIGLRTDVTKSVAGYLDMMERELGSDFLHQLGLQDPKVYPSAVPMTQAVASGEIGVTNSSLPSLVKELKDNGAPIDSMIPSPGYGFEFGAAALETSKRPNAAAVFVDFIMSPAGQAAINGDGFGGSAGITDVPGALDPGGLIMLDSAKFTPEVLAGWETKLADYYG